MFCKATAAAVCNKLATLYNIPYVHSHRDSLVDFRFRNDLFYTGDSRPIQCDVQKEVALYHGFHESGLCTAEVTLITTSSISRSVIFWSIGTVSA